MATDATDPTTMTARTTIQLLARLPNELLSTICSWLPIPDVRVLGHVNRWLQGFTVDYLRVYQYKLGLFRLLDTILSRILQELDQIDHSRLARASPRLYPNLMGPLIVRDITGHGLGKNKSMFYAARRGDLALAQKIVALGANLETLRFIISAFGWSHHLNCNIL